MVDRLCPGNDVVVLDNLSAGKREFIQSHLEKGDIEFIEGDIMDTSTIEQAMKGVDIVFHLAANPDVRVGAVDTYTHLEQNVLATYRVLEAMRKSGVKDIAFTSTSTVYGEAKIIPTPEDYGPLVPISLYGASKLACEALISSYAYTFDMNAVYYRFANVVGSRSTHGVTYDFVRKLKRDPHNLEILGDGKQTKSYFYISDCIDAMVFSYEHTDDRVGIYNIGSEDYIDVTTVADAIAGAMGLKDVNYHYTGGVDGGRGWKGDVKVMLLSIERLKRIGWTPEFSSRESIEMAAQDVLRELEK